jgi:hypothetical protein
MLIVFVLLFFSKKNASLGRKAEKMANHENECVAQGVASRSFESASIAY